MITISIENAAKELAKELKNTVEYSKYRQAYARIKLDPTAQDIMTSMEQIQLNTRNACGRTAVDEEFQNFTNCSIRL